MKYPASIPILVLLFLSAASAKTRVSDIGSHPYLSTKVFPQEMLKWQGNFFYYYPNYMKAPWWGDIDEPGNKPKVTYVSTGQGVAKGGAEFEHKGALHTVGNQAGFSHRFRDNLAGSFQLDYTMDAMRNSAEGKMSHFEEDTVSGTNSLVGYIPFDYFNRHTLNSLNLQSMTGFLYHNNPAGFKASVRYKNTLVMNQKFSFSKNDVEYESDRTVWGWDTKGCNHIFGPRGTEGDAWLQRTYARGPQYTADLQGGITLPWAKMGLMLQYTGQRQDQYKWKTDTTTSTGDPVLDKNFQGKYVKSDWSRKYREGNVRFYTNLNWKRGRRHALNTWLSMGYGASTALNALANNPSVEDDAKAKNRSMAMEFGPNINITLGEVFHYIDAACILEYGHTRFNNTYERNVSGGRKEAFRSSRVVVDDEPAWENFSYANNNYLDIRTDLSAMFPVHNTSVSHLGLGILILVDTRYTFLSKYYGNPTDNGKTVSFDVTGKRKNFMREFWFNTALMLQYMAGPLHVRFEITEPLLYSLIHRTRVLDSGNNLRHEHRTEPLWISQQGVRIGLYVSKQMTMPFLR